MNVTKILKNSDYSAPITGLVVFVWSVPSQAMNIDRDSVDEDAYLVAGCSPDQSGQYKGCTL